MRDIRITKDENGYWDLKLESGKFSLAEDGTQAAQHVLARLLTFKGELTLGDNIESQENNGTDWYGIVFNMSKSLAEKQLEIKSRILKTPGIKKIVTFGWEQSGHSVTIDDTIVQTDWGEEDISQEITPL